MGFNFDFGHSKGPKMHFLVFCPIKTACYVSVFKNNFFFIDLESLPIVTANFDEYESKSVFCPYYPAWVRLSSLGKVTQAG